MKKNQKNGYVYFRYPDHSQAFIHNDPIGMMIFNNDEIIDNRCDECYLSWDECLGNIKPMDRYGFSSMLSTIYDRNIKTLFLVNLTDISTNPKILATTLYDLVRREIEVVVLSDGTIINRENIEDFNFCGVLAQAKTLISQNDNGRFDLLVHKDGHYDIWHDTLEKMFYYCSLKTKEIHLIELNGAVVKDKWDSITLKRNEYKAFCNATDFSQLYETIRHNNTEYYVRFSIDYDAEEAGCGATLNDDVLNETYRGMSYAKLFNDFQ